MAKSVLQLRRIGYVLLRDLCSLTMGAFMLKKLTGALCALFVMSSAASATTLEITGFANHQAHGFATSGFFVPKHSCDYKTCGEFVEFAAGSGKGWWWTDTGEIRFKMDLVGGGVAKAHGWVDVDNPVDGAVGRIGVTIAGSTNGNDGKYDFLFRDYLYNAEAGVQGANGHRLALLGVDGAKKYAHDGGFRSGDLGVALRAEVSAVPVPPAIALMLAGLGGLGIAGARRKNKSA